MLLRLDDNVWINTRVIVSVEIKRTQHYLKDNVENRSDYEEIEDTELDGNWKDGRYFTHKTHHTIYFHLMNGIREKKERLSAQDAIDFVKGISL